MKDFIIRVLVTGAVIFGIAYLLPSLLSVRDFQSAVLAALVLAIANALVRPVVLVLTIPINLLTLGLFTLVVNALMLYLVAEVVSGFVVVGFWQAIVAAILISAVSTFFATRLED